MLLGGYERYEKHWVCHTASDIAFEGKTTQGLPVGKIYLKDSIGSNGHTLPMISIGSVPDLHAFLIIITI